MSVTNDGGNQIVVCATLGEQLASSTLSVYAAEKTVKYPCLTCYKAGSASAGIPVVLVLNQPSSSARTRFKLAPADLML